MLIKKHRLFTFYLILTTIILFLFLSFIYPDILITTKHSVNLLQVIFNGHPMDFYSINYGFKIDDSITNFNTASYELPIYVIFAIWNIPLWLMQHFFRISITESFLSLIWLKSILIIFFFLCLSMIRKICVEINIDKKYIPWVLFFVVSSPLWLMPLFIMDQYDIIPLLFILLGILNYIKDDKKLFLLFFSIAIPLKMFAIFIFIPLILLQNKKILKIIQYGLIGLVPLSITKSISFGMHLYRESTAAFNGRMFQRLFESTVNINLGSASLFFASFTAILIFCYYKKIKNKEELNAYSIYIPLLSLSSFFIFVLFHPQWTILLVPFMSIIVFYNIKNLKINILLDMFVSASCLISTVFFFYWCYGSIVVQKMIIPRLFGSTLNKTLVFPSVSDLLTRFRLNEFLPVYLAIFAISLIAMLVINFPNNKEIVKKSNKVDIEYGLIFTRMLIIIPIPILMIFCYYYVK